MRFAYPGHGYRMHVNDERPPERDVDEMEERVERLENEISDTKQDWERKRKNPGVPGALEPEEHDDDDA